MSKNLNEEDWGTETPSNDNESNLFETKQQVTPKDKFTLIKLILLALFLLLVGTGILKTVYPCNKGVADVWNYSTELIEYALPTLLGFIFGKELSK